MTDSSPSKFDPLIQSEDIAFREEELVPCPKCGRKGAPDRVACLYCSAALGTKPIVGSRLRIQKVEPWEKGQNVVVLSSSGDVRTLSSLFSLDIPAIEKIFQSGAPFPVARVGSVGEAEAVVRALPGVGTIIVSDKDLDAAHPPRRIAGLSLNNGRLGLVDFNTRLVTSIKTADLAFVVTGRIISGRTDSLEKRKRGKPKNVLEETSMSTDEAVIDLYTGEDRTGYRVYNSGFDFSCLGAEKGMLASENMSRLITHLVEIAPGARLVTAYPGLAELLSDVWPLEVRKDHQGLVRSGIGKREFGMTEITSNAEQFTKYSRLQWYAR